MLYRFVSWLDIYVTRKLGSFHKCANFYVVCVMAKCSQINIDLASVSREDRWVSEDLLIAGSFTTKLEFAINQQVLVSKHVLQASSV